MSLWYRRVLALLIVVGVLAGIPDAIARIRTESASRHVELVAGQHTFSALARAEGSRPAAFLKSLRASGVRGLAVSETTLLGLESSGAATVQTGHAWLAARLAAGAAPPPFQIQPHDVYVVTRSTALGRWLPTALRGTLPRAWTVSVHTLGGATVVSIASSLATLEKVPLGFAPGSFKLARQLHMDVLPRLQNTRWGLSSTAVAALLQRVDSAGVPVHVIVFAGEGVSIPGYPHDLGLVSNWMRSHHLLLGAIETPDQLTNIHLPGVVHLNNALGQRTVRVYSVPTWLVNKYSANHARISLMSGVVERNLRVLYLHPILTGAHPLAQNVSFYHSLVTILAGRGFVLGTPRPFAAITVPTYARVLEGLAILAGGLWLLAGLFPDTRRLGWWPLIVLGTATAGVAAVSHTLAPLVGALAAASVFGGLSVLWGARRWQAWQASDGDHAPGLGRLWLRGMGLAITMAAITALGGYLVATLLGSTPFMLDWAYFRGVKLTFLGTPFLAALAFVVYVGLAPEGGRIRGLWREFSWAGEESVKFKYVLVFLVLAAIGGYYMLRSGNVSASLVPSIELRERDFLAQVFTYRPLEKEFLVGYPSILLLPLCAAKRQRWAYLFFLLGAAVGQVSIMDAFITLRTPLLNSTLRETYGLLLGLCTGTVGLIVIHTAVRLAARWRARGGQPAA